MLPIVSENLLAPADSSRYSPIQATASSRCPFKQQRPRMRSDMSFKDDSKGLMCNGFQVKSEEDYMSYLLQSHDTSLTQDSTIIRKKNRPKYMDRDRVLNQRVRSEINRSLMKGQTKSGLPKKQSLQKRFLQVQTQQNYYESFMHVNGKEVDLDSKNEIMNVRRLIGQSPELSVNKSADYTAR